MLIEKFRSYEKQTILNILAPDTDWHNLTFGAFACPNPNITGWGQVLKERKSLFLKNQGVSNDNTTAGTVEIYFGAYHVDHIKRTVTYNANTGLYTFTTDPVNPQLIPTSDVTYLTFDPYGVATSDVSGRQIISAVLRDVTNIGGTSSYTFTLDGEEIITGTDAIGAWTPTAAWTYAAATGWHHSTGNITTLVVDTGWVPTIGETYNIKITNTTTVSGAGFHVTCGGAGTSDVFLSGTQTFSFTAQSAAPLTFIPAGGGTWVGNITSVSVKVNNNHVNEMLQNNIAHRKVDFYKYSVPALTTERGILLTTGETYSADITHDVVLYYKGSAQNQTLVVQQFA